MVQLNVNWSSEKIIVKCMAVLHFSQWPLISHTTNRETIQRRQKWVRKISKENLTLESQQSQWQQGFHVSHTLYKSDVTFTSSSGVNNVRENETLFLACVEVRVPNLNKLKWKNLNIVQDLPTVLSLMILLEFSKSVILSFPSFLSSFLLSSLFLPSSTPSFFLPSPLFLSSNIFQVSTKCQTPVYIDRKTQFLPSWSLQSTVGNELEIDEMTTHSDKTSCEVWGMEGSGRVRQARVGLCSRQWEYIYAYFLSSWAFRKTFLKSFWSLSKWKC